MVLHWCLEESGDVIQPGDCQWLTTGQQQCHNVQQLKIWWGCRNSWWIQIWNLSPNPVTASDSQTISSSSLRVSQCTASAETCWKSTLMKTREIHVQIDTCLKLFTFLIVNVSDSQTASSSNSSPTLYFYLYLYLHLCEHIDVFLSISVFSSVWAHRDVRLRRCMQHM